MSLLFIILKVILLLWVVHAVILGAAFFFEDMLALFKIHDVTGPKVWSAIKTAVGVFLIVLFLPCIWVSNWWANWRHGK
jgi:hypothetical protein